MATAPVIGAEPVVPTGPVVAEPVVPTGPVVAETILPNRTVLAETVLPNRTVVATLVPTGTLLPAGAVVTALGPVGATFLAVRGPPILAELLAATLGAVLAAALAGAVPALGPLGGGPALLGSSVGLVALGLLRTGGLRRARGRAQGLGQQVSHLRTPQDPHRWARQRPENCGSRMAGDEPGSAPQWALGVPNCTAQPGEPDLTSRSQFNRIDPAGHSSTESTRSGPPEWHDRAGPGEARPPARPRSYNPGCAQRRSETLSTSGSAAPGPETWPSSGIRSHPAR